MDQEPRPPVDAPPTTAPPPSPAARPTPSGRPGKSRNPRARLAVALLAGMTLLLCLGGAGIAFVLYDDATKIDRGSPDAAVDNYLRAYLVNRDDKEAALFRCKSAGELNALTQLRAEMANRERNFDVRVGVSWSALAVTRVSDSRQSVGVDLIISGSSNGQTRSRRIENWAFDVVDEDGWRVCGATKVA